MQSRAQEPHYKGTDIVCGAELGLTGIRIGAVPRVRACAGIRGRPSAILGIGREDRTNVGEDWGKRVILEDGRGQSRYPRRRRKRAGGAKETPRGLET